MNRIIWAAAMLVPMAGTLAQAQTFSALSAQQAQKIVTACAAHAAAKGQSQGIAVVDSGGHSVATLRMDGNSFGVMDFALKKAQAAAAWGRATSAVGEAAKGNPGFASAPHIVLIGGGVPIFDASGTNLIGGAGASGEPPLDDENCIKAGIAAAGLRDTPMPRP